MRKTFHLIILIDPLTFQILPKHFDFAIFLKLACSCQPAPSLRLSAGPKTTLQRVKTLDKFFKVMNLNLLNKQLMHNRRKDDSQPFISFRAGIAEENNNSNCQTDQIKTPCTQALLCPV